jgi:hypothetical protein
MHCDLQEGRDALCNIVMDAFVTGVRRSREPGGSLAAGVSVDVEQLLVDVMKAWEAEHERVCAALDEAVDCIANAKRAQDRALVRDIFTRHMAPYMTEIDSDGITEERTLEVASLRLL